MFTLFCGWMRAECCEKHFITAAIVLVFSVKISHHLPLSTFQRRTTSNKGLNSVKGLTISNLIRPLFLVFSVKISHHLPLSTFQRRTTSNKGLNSVKGLIISNFMYLGHSLWLFRNPPWFHKSCVFLYYIPLQWAHQPMGARGWAVDEGPLSSWPMGRQGWAEGEGSLSRWPMGRRGWGEGEGP